VINKIRKRNGRTVVFDKDKITEAIFKAAKSVGGEDRKTAKDLTEQIIGKLEDKYDSIPTVEDIQDVVEKMLIENGHAKTAKAYILYRKQHEEIRDFNNLLLNAENMIEDYVDGSTWRINENSNSNYSLQGLNNHIISAVTSNYWLEKVYPEEIKKAHKNGDLHIHDLNLLAPYCCGWNIHDILTKGFSGVNQKVESAPPKHFRSALGQIVNFFYTLQGESAGAQALSNFDTYLAPFIRFDGLNYIEVEQAVQEFVFNLNVPTRVGFQTPFVNLTMDVVIPEMLKNEPVILGGEYLMNSQYGDFQEEMDMLNTAFCKVMMAGDAKGRIFTFPIPTYNISDDFNWESPVAEKIMKMTAKYGIPYFANFINSDLSPEDVRSMCCRLRLDNRELQKRGGGLFGANPLTGSIGVVTINLPRIGYLADDDTEFFKLLKKQMDFAKESLLIKRSLLEKFIKMGLYPYSEFYLRDVSQKTNEYWRNHFNTIGLVGMNEALINLMGENIASEKGKMFALRVLNFMREVLVVYQEETGQLFNLEATPAEGTAYRLAKLDKKMYPDIITSGSNEPYYTNSTHLPVEYTDDIFEALDIQEELQLKYTGGTVFHGFIGEKITDINNCKKLLKLILSNYKIPYFTISPTFSICQNHGYLIGEQTRCPFCDEETEVWSRVVGFYRPVQNWNKGKKEEFVNRKEFSVGEIKGAVLYDKGLA
jgi:ribonucleoside-triphosphate reductase